MIHPCLSLAEYWIHLHTFFALFLGNNLNLIWPSMRMRRPGGICREASNGYQIVLTGVWAPTNPTTTVQTMSKEIIFSSQTAPLDSNKCWLMLHYLQARWKVPPEPLSPPFSPKFQSRSLARLLPRLLRYFIMVRNTLHTELAGWVYIQWTGSYLVEFVQTQNS